MFRARWAALALSAGLLVTASGCFGHRWAALHKHGECECMETYGGPGYDVPGVEGPIMQPPTYGTGLPPTPPPPTMAPPPRIVPIPANPQPYSPTKFFRR